MYNIKFDIHKGEYILSLPSCNLYYNGEVDSDTLKILETIKNIADSHYREKIDKRFVENLKEELKDKIQEQGYEFEFIEG